MDSRSDGASEFGVIGEDEGFVTAGPLNTSLAGPFYGQMGFDIMDSNATTIYADDAWHALQKLVSRHDQPGIEELLVSATAPVAGGFAFPSDLLTTALALEQADVSALQANHIKRVYIHVWLIRSIHVLETGTPGYVELAQDEEATKALRPDLYMPDYNLYDRDATELVGTGLNDVFVRHDTATGERQVFVRTGEVRDGFPVWRRDEMTIESESRE